MCVDYQSMNAITIKDPIPLIKKLLEELGGSIIFSKIDLRAGYCQVKMTPEDSYDCI